MIPKIRKNVNFKEGEIIIPDETIKYLSEAFTENAKKELGIEKMFGNNSYKIEFISFNARGGQIYLKKEKTLKVDFPFTVTKEVVDKLIKKQEGNGAPYGIGL